MYMLWIVWDKYNKYVGLKNDWYLKYFKNEMLMVVDGIFF